MCLRSREVRLQRRPNGVQVVYSSERPHGLGAAPYERTSSRTGAPSLHSMAHVCHWVRVMALGPQRTTKT